jgi:hypothetical protein
VDEGACIAGSKFNVLGSTFFGFEHCRLRSAHRLLRKAQLWERDGRGFRKTLNPFATLRAGFEP